VRFLMPGLSVQAGHEWNLPAAGGGFILDRGNVKVSLLHAKNRSERNGWQHRRDPAPQLQFRRGLAIVIVDHGPWSHPPGPGPRGLPITRPTGCPRRGQRSGRSRQDLAQKPELNPMRPDEKHAQPAQIP